MMMLMIMITRYMESGKNPWGRMRPTGNVKPFRLSLCFSMVITMAAMLATDDSDWGQLRPEELQMRIRATRESRILRGPVSWGHHQRCSVVNIHDERINISILYIKRERGKPWLLQLTAMRMSDPFQGNHIHLSDNSNDYRITLKQTTAIYKNARTTIDNAVGKAIFFDVFKDSFVFSSRLKPEGWDR